MYRCIDRYTHTHSLLDLRMSSLRRGHANLRCVVPMFTDDPRRESECNASLIYIYIYRYIYIYIYTYVYIYI